MIPAVALAALTASVAMHVSWNLMARRADPHALFLWWAALSGLILIGPWSITALIRETEWSWNRAGLLGLSCSAETLYFIALGIAYRRAPVPLVYPIARSSPLLIALWMALLFGERLPLTAWIGIAISVAGVLTLALSARGGDPWRAVPWALTAALGTSIYSIANKFAVGALPSYSAILGWASVTTTVAWAGLTIQHLRQTGRWIPAVRPPTWQWLAAGVFLANAYGLVIFAMRYIPAAYALALSNAGIVVAGIIAMTWFRERERWRMRLAAIVIISAGLSLLALG
jgi:phosphonate utilization associated putative membrane protein